MTKLTYHLFWIKCSDCQHEGRFPVYQSAGYMLLFNPQNFADVRLWDWSDNTFREVSKLAQSEELVVLDKLNLSKLHRTIIVNMVNTGQLLMQFSADSHDGVKYEFNPPKICSKCFSHNILGWGPTENPAETKEAVYPYLTHRNWDDLTADKQEALIKGEVERMILAKLSEIKDREFEEQNLGVSKLRWLKPLSCFLKGN